MIEPACFGYFDVKDQECTGEEEAEECSRLMFCRSFKLYLGANGLAAERYLEERFVDGEVSAVPIYDDAQWENFLAGCRRAYGRRKDPGRPRKRRRRALTSTEKVRALLGDTGTVKPLRTTTAKPRRRVQRLEEVGQLHERLWELTEHFFVKFLDATDLILSDRKAAAVPGRLYFTNKWSVAGYIALYMRTSKRHDRLVVSVHPKPRFKSLVIQLPFEEADLAAELRKRGAKRVEFSPDARRTSAQAKTVITGVRRETGAILAEVIAALAKRQLSPSGTVPSAGR